MTPTKKPEHVLECKQVDKLQYVLTTDENGSLGFIGAARK